MLNAKEMAAQVLVALKSHFDSAMVPVRREIADLAAKVAAVPVPKDGKDGANGRDGVDGAKGIDGIHGRDGRDGKDGEKGLAGERGLQGERGLEGQKGVDGKDGAQGPAGRDGRDGERGPPGKDGEPGATGEKGDTGLAGKDGSNGLDGKDGAAGINGKDGADGVNGKDGTSVTLADVEPMMKMIQAEWEVDFERRANHTLQRAIDRMPAAKDGKDGTDGKDGVDGFGFDDFDVEFDGQRTFTFKWTQGERVKTKTFKPPIVLYKGVYKASEGYEKGDSVTYGGSLWIAQKDAPGTPGDGSSWKLSVKKGVDAK